MPEPHGLCSVLLTARLCSRDVDVCHSERSAAQWLGVRPGYPQVRDGSVLRWTLCAAVSCIDILTRHAESHRCPSSWQPAVYLRHPNGNTSHTVTPVHHFHLTVNLQRTVERQYCTYHLQVYYKLELEALHCSSWSKPNVFVLLSVSEMWMQSELLYLTLCTHGHCVSDCRIKMFGRKGKVDLSCTGLRTDCSTADYEACPKSKCSDFSYVRTGNVTPRWCISARW